MSAAARGARAAGLEGLRERYDVLIIGGGIYGATAAWEAASRGLSVALFEKGDFGSGTSANSLKVIHGGIRYLQSMDLARLRQSVRERRALLRIAPHLVQPMQCVVPTYRDLPRSKPVLWMATRAYDWLALDRNHGVDPARRIDRSSTVSLPELERLAPGLSGSDMTGGASWWDAQVHHSERLVMAFVMSARQRNAHVYNYARVAEYIVERGRVRGVVVEDGLTGRNAEVLSSVTLDCRGPWVCADQRFQQALEAQGAEFATAMNLVVGRKLARCAIGVRVANEGGSSAGARLLFLAPWREGTLMGTWYYGAKCSPDDMSISRPLVQDALRQVNAAFPSARLESSDVTTVHLGQLPARPAQGAGTEPEPAANYAVLDGADHGARGLIWVQGVKYTTARDVAAKALRAAARYLDKGPGPSMSHRVPLYGGAIADVESFRRSRMERYGRRLTTATISRLFDNYGSCMDAVIAYTDEHPELAAPVPGTGDTIRAEVEYVLEHEAPATLSDLMLRRTDFGALAVPPAETIEFCADAMAEKCGWSDAVKGENIRSLYRHYPEWATAQPRDEAKAI